MITDQHIIIFPDINEIIESEEYKSLLRKADMEAWDFFFDKIFWEPSQFSLLEYIYSLTPELALF